jgi:hypothetical protein
VRLDRAVESADQERGMVSWEEEGGREMLWWKVRRDSADLTRASGCDFREVKAYNAVTVSAYSLMLR